MVHYNDVYLTAATSDAESNSNCTNAAKFLREPDYDSAETLLERGDFQVRCAITSGGRSKSSALCNRRYAWRGYKQSAYDETMTDPNQVTIQACRGDYVFGTLTLRFDSDAGLAADALYGTEIGAYRNRGAQVCELTRLAIDPEQGSKEVLGAMFHVAYIYGGLLWGMTDVFVEVNPRHASYYRRMLSFHPAGECRLCDRVEAPAILLHLRVAYVAEQIALHGGGRTQDRHSLYRYFVSREEEETLRQRILGCWEPKIRAQSQRCVAAMDMQRGTAFEELAHPAFLPELTPSLAAV